MRLNIILDFSSIYRLDSRMALRMGVTVDRLVHHFGLE